MASHTFLLGFVVLALAPLGCGSGGPGAPVEGVVTLNGQPLADANVSLMRGTGPKEERYYLGKTDQSGHYALMNPATKQEGVAPGDYQLRITSVQVPVDATEDTPLPPERVPAEYQSGRLTLSVPAEGLTSQDYTITTKR